MSSAFPPPPVRAMADIMEASPSNTCGPVTIRREEYINQFRVAFLTSAAALLTGDFKSANRYGTAPALGFAAIPL